jgi:chromosome segregation ATPase
LPEPEQVDDELLGEPAPSIASTARISLVSKPPSLLAEHRSLPALPRRTTPLPGLKTLFQNPPADAPLAPPVVEMPMVITQPLPEAPTSRPEKPEPPVAETIPKLIDPLAAGDDDLAGIWQKMALLNEELAQTIQERDHALGDINQLRDQLRLADELVARNRGAVTSDELAQIARDRDEAQAELKALKEKPVAPKGDSQKMPLAGDITKTKEIVFLTQERDEARKEYAELRKQFEGLKREQAPSGPPPLPPREDAAKVRRELEQQLEGFRLKLEEKNKEIAALKAAPPPAPPPLPAPASGEADEKLKAELATLKEQVTKAKEDASIASRGLALSQKALQETREALREATEGTSLSRHNFDNLKNECASLTQQNTVLQAQNEQLSRELAAAKQRQSGRVQM